MGFGGPESSSSSSSCISSCSSSRLRYEEDGMRSSTIVCVGPSLDNAVLDKTQWDGCMSKAHQFWVGSDNSRSSTFPSMNMFCKGPKLPTTD